VIRSSGSVGANYIEANESLSKKDFLYRIKIIRKEAKESAYFLRLILETNEVEFNKEASELFNEALELKKIFSAIIIITSCRQTYVAVFPPLLCPQLAKVSN
jgi:four helix bundle protein